MLGAIFKARQHISIDILPASIPEKYLAVLFVFFDVVSLLFALLLCYGGIKFALMVMKTGVYSVSVSFIPMWIVRLSVPLGGLFLFFFSLEHLLLDIRPILKRQGDGQ